jgi:hypothetical protein
LKALVEYIIRFLLDRHPACEEIIPHIGYTGDENDFHRYKIVIVPSGFFDAGRYGTSGSLPELPLKKVENSILLYGIPEIVRRNDQLIVKADIIASAFFLLSRYEEYVGRDVRDGHGRFPGKASLPFRAGFLNRPVVDEYGQLLRKWLREVRIELPEPAPDFNRIFLTVDVDVPFLYRTIKGLARGLLSPGKQIAALKSYFIGRRHDPACTFPWMAEQNRTLTGLPCCEQIYFFKSGGKTSEDKPFYNLRSKDMQSLFAFCKTHRIQTGLHASYHAGLHPDAIEGEKEALEKATRSVVTCNRHHFLTCREPEDFRFLSACGITDDFTMGYADVSGFRLGTCRSVLWINPADRKVYPLTLHPLTIMDCTLAWEKYMNLSFDEAVDYCTGLIDQTRKHHGDLTLLWHNHYLIPAPGNWEKELYRRLTELCRVV